MLLLSNKIKLIRGFCLIAAMVCCNSLAAQNNHVAARFTFNGGKPLNEINGKLAHDVGVLYVKDRFGNNKSACYLQGSPWSYLNLGTAPELKPEKASISLWVRVDIAMESGKGFQINPILLTKNGVADKEGKYDDFFEGYSILYDYKMRKFVTTMTRSEELQVAIHTSDTIKLREWHHLVMTYDDDSSALYLDGALEAKLPKKFKSVFLASDSVMVGNSANKKNDRYFCGAIDDIVIYNRVISADEVTELYHAPDPNTYNVYLKWFYRLLAIAIIIAITVWFLLRKLRNDLEKQKEKTRINARLNELETRAIRTQMNPHFMFNALNTLQRFILEEDIANAHSYLIKFSKLLRKLLESSVSDSISLKEEIEILNSYLEIEMLRFDKSFEYTIESNIANPDKVLVPFMLVQPFIENAIWHGLMAKQGARRLHIKFSDIDENSLLCQIDDNGVGRKHSFKQKDPFKKKSMAIEFIKQRLDILEKATGIKTTFNIIDKENATGESEGTLVEIIIPKFK